MLALMVARVFLIQQVRGSIPGGVVFFHLKNFNLGVRRGRDVHFLIARSVMLNLSEGGVGGFFSFHFLRTRPTKHYTPL